MHPNLVLTCENNLSTELESEDMSAAAVESPNVLRAATTTTALAPAFANAGAKAFALSQFNVSLFPTNKVRTHLKAEALAGSSDKYYSPSL